MYIILHIILLSFFFFSHRSPPRSRALTSPAHSQCTSHAANHRSSATVARPRPADQSDNFCSIRARSHALTHVLVYLHINKYEIRVYNKRRHRCCCWDVVYLSCVCVSVCVCVYRVNRRQATKCVEKKSNLHNIIAYTITDYSIAV